MSSTPGLPYVAGIDGLRAIAVLAVIVFHVEFLRFLPGGFTGVDMFFVISGYVISRSLAEKGQRPLRTFLLQFYQRRLLRILPALLLVLTASVLISALIIPPVWLSSQNEDTGLAAFLGLSNLVLAWQTDSYFSPKAEFNLYLHTWSLGVEEHFYLILPVVFVLWLRWPALTYVGRLSYSLYLWHWPVAVFLRWTVGLETLSVQLAYPLLVLGLAAASYHAVEEPVRRGRTLWHRRAGWSVIGGLSAIGLCAALAAWTIHSTERFSLSTVADTYTWHAYRHYPREPIEKVDLPALQDRQLFVLGDSHTAAYRTMLNIVSLRLGIKVVEYERGGCAVVSLLDADPPACATWRSSALADIQVRAKPGDVVFLASLRMPELTGRDWWKGEDAIFEQARGERTAQHAQAARQAADAVLEPLQAAGLTVLIDAPSPVFKAPANRCSDPFNRTNPICAPGLSVERDRILQLRAPQMHLLTILAREYPALHVWDPLPTLCPGTRCSAYDSNEKPLFADADHLSGHGNRVLEPSFTTLLIHLYAPKQPR